MLYDIFVPLIGIVSIIKLTNEKTDITTMQTRKTHVINENTERHATNFTFTPVAYAEHVRQLIHFL